MVAVAAEDRVLRHRDGEMRSPFGPPGAGAALAAQRDLLAVLTPAGIRVVTLAPSAARRVAVVPSTAS